MSKDIYPLTIIKDRYDGTFSGGKYLAINNFHNEIDGSIGGCDSEEMIFWDNFKQGIPNGFLGEKVFIGKGNCVNSALLNLEILLSTIDA